ncbi:MAG: exodeoxyribonuclease V subunit gamma [Bacillaceae bacterium]|nr:exodeoxyribonuclease V subunit gamma [Bacillaceae bacterium]
MKEKHPNRILYTGNAHRAIRERWLDEVAAQLEPGSWIWLVPGRDQAVNLRRRVMQKSDTGLIDPRFITFDELTRMILEKSESGYYMMPRHLQQRILAELMTRPENGEITWEGRPLESYASSTSVLNGILQVIAMLKRHLVQPEDLNRAEVDSSEEYRILVALYRGYQEKILRSYDQGNTGMDGQLLDLEEQYLEAGRLLQQEGVHHFFPSLEKVYVDSFVELEPIQRLILQALFEVHQVEICFPYVREQWAPLSAVQQEASELFRFFRQHGFEFQDGEKELDNSNKELCPAYYAAAAASEEKEWLYVLKQIKSLLKKGTAPEQIAIVTHRKPGEQDFLHQLIQEEQIPVRYTFARPLMQIPEVDDLGVLYTLGENRFDRDSLSHLDDSPLFAEAAPGEDSPSRRPLRVAYWAGKMGIYAGLDTWYEILDRELSRQEHEELKRLRSWLEQLEQMVAGVPEKGTLIEHVRAMENMINTLNWKKEESGRRMLQLLAELRRTSRHVQDRQRLTPSEFIRFLNEAGQGVKAHTSKIKQGVWFLEPIQARGFSFTHMFFVGMNEGEFPAGSSRLWFVTDRLQKELREVIEFPRVLRAREQFQKIHFYQAVESAEQTCTFSYLAGRRDLLRSRYLDEWMRQFPVEEVNTGDYLNGSRLYPEDWDQISNPREWRDWIAAQLAQSLPAELPQDSKVRAFPSVPHAGETGAPVDWEDMIHRALIEQAREEGTDHPYHGRITSQSIRERITSKLPRAFSVTYFNTYGQCPFKFFLSRLVKLDEAEEETEDMDHLEKGNIYHAVLQQLYRELFPQGAEAGDATGPELPPLTEILSRAEQLFDEQWQAIFSERYQAESLRNRIEKERMLDKLKRFIRFDLERLTETPFKPRYFEWAFGMSRHGGGGREDTDQGSVEAPLLIRGVPFRGVIDRIDTDGHGLFVVFDYKTSGGAVDVKHMKEGYDFQLPVYVRAVKELLMGGEGSAVGAAYYSVEKRDYAAKSVFHKERMEGKGLDLDGLVRGKKEEDWEMLMEESLEKIPRYLDGIQQGDFRVAPRVDLTHCNRYCPYRRICRYNPMSRDLEGDDQ